MSAARLALLLTVLCPLSSSADSGQSRCYATGCRIVLTGTISREDADRVGSLLAAPRAGEDSSTVIFELNSTGGSVAPAMALGRLARARRAVTSVARSAVCYSACVYVLAGGVQRVALGQVGIHSSYDPVGSDASYEASKRSYEAIKRSVKEYLAEMNVSDALFDRMVRIPPAEMQVLSSDEVYQYGLRGTDPVWRDSLEIAAANGLGISRGEYVRRRALVAERCAPLGRSGDARAWARCEDRVMASGR